MECNYSKETDIILPTIRRAGEKLMQFFKKPDLQVRYKTPNQPVTEADFVANSILLLALTKYFPEDGILSEEAESSLIRDQQNQKRLGKNRVWIIDPLDGTQEFIDGEPNFSVSIGLVVNGVARWGAIYNPAKEYLVWTDSKKVYSNDKETYSIKSPNISKSNLRVIFSKSEMQKNLFKDFLNSFSYLTINKIGSIAFKLALVCSYDYDLVLSRKPKHEWDLAGGAALLNALNYPILNLEKKPIQFNQKNPTINGVIAGHPEAVKIYIDFLESQKIF